MRIVDRMPLVSALVVTVAVFLITIGGPLGHGQQPAPLGLAGPANPVNSAPPPTPGVPITWQSTLPPIPAVVSGVCPCVEITPDRDKHTLIAANRCSDTVSVLGARDKNLLPFVPITPSPGREFTIVQVPRTDYVEFAGLTPITSFGAIFLSCPGTPSAPPVLRCQVNFDQVTEGTFAPSCDVNGKALGDTCTCPKFRDGATPPVAIGTFNGEVAIFPAQPPAPH